MRISRLCLFELLIVLVSVRRLCVMARFRQMPIVLMAADWFNLLLFPAFIMPRLKIFSPSAELDDQILLADCPEKLDVSPLLPSFLSFWWSFPLRGR